MIKVNFPYSASYRLGLITVERRHVQLVLFRIEIQTHLNFSEMRMYLHFQIVQNLNKSKITKKIWMKFESIRIVFENDKFVRISVRNKMNCTCLLCVSMWGGGGERVQPAPPSGYPFLSLLLPYIADRYSDASHLYNTRCAQGSRPLCPPLTTGVLQYHYKQV